MDGNWKTKKQRIEVFFVFWKQKSTEMVRSIRDKVGMLTGKYFVCFEIYSKQSVFTKKIHFENRFYLYEKSILESFGSFFFKVLLCSLNLMSFFAKNSNFKFIQSTLFLSFPSSDKDSPFPYAPKNRWRSLFKTLKDCSTRRKQKSCQVSFVIIIFYTAFRMFQLFPSYDAFAHRVPRSWTQFWNWNQLV